jgi:hypothetical protein
MKIIDIEDFKVNLARLTPGRQNKQQEKTEQSDPEFFHGNI